MSYNLLSWFITAISGFAGIAVFYWQKYKTQEIKTKFAELTERFIALKNENQELIYENRIFKAQASVEINPNRTLNDVLDGLSK